MGCGSGGGTGKHWVQTGAGHRRRHAVGRPRDRVGRTRSSGRGGRDDSRVADRDARDGGDGCLRNNAGREYRAPAGNGWAGFGSLRWVGVLYGRYPVLETIEKGVELTQPDVELSQNVAVGSQPYYDKNNIFYFTSCYRSRTFQESHYWTHRQIPK